MPEIPASLQQIIKVCEKISVGEATPGDLNGLFVKARQVIAFERTGLERFTWDAIWTDTFQNLVKKLQSELEAHEKALQDLENSLNDIETFAIEKAGRDLKYSTEAVATLWDELNAEVGEQMVMSPYPVYDHLLKVGQNILQGHVEPSVLAAFFTPAADFTIRLRAAVKRFVLFYGESSLSECAQKVMTNVEAGMGAMDKFLQNGQTKALDDALHLLVTTTVTMYTVMSDMGQCGSRGEKGRQYGRLDVAL